MQGGKQCRLFPSSSHPSRYGPGLVASEQVAGVAGPGWCGLEREGSYEGNVTAGHQPSGGLWWGDLKVVPHPFPGQRRPRSQGASKGGQGHRPSLPPAMVGTSLAPRDVPVPGTCDCVTAHTTRDFADVIESIEMGRFSCIFWAS